MPVLRAVVTSLASLALTAAAAGQSTLDQPVGQFAPYALDTGAHANDRFEAAVVYRDVVQLPGAAWLRLYFEEVILGVDSFVRMTSIADGEVQELDSAGLLMWSDTSAYFNGDTVLLELIAGPATAHNRLVLDRVAFELGGGPDGSCGICGPDDRVPSSQDWAGRILPVGCSGSVWNEESCVVSAGHCVGGDVVIQFRVPPSNPDCSLNHPPVDDQFPITSRLFENAGVGADWAVMTTGVNNLNQTAYERYGELRRIAVSPADEGDACANWGYGIDSECTRNQVQQTHAGDIVDVNPTNYQFWVDITFGNSGSALLKGDEIIGIVTHCTENCPNFATRVDKPVFRDARNQLCPPSSPQTFGPDSFGITFGNLVGGGLAELQDSDDQKLIVRQRSAISPLLPVVRVLAEGFGSFTALAEMQVVLESSATALPATVPQRIELFNFDSSDFEQIDERTATLGDSIVSVAITDNPSRFIASWNGRIFARFDWFNPGATISPNWDVRIDQVEWTIVP